jgi:hypothetical protein
MFEGSSAIGEVAACLGLAPSALRYYELDARIAQAHAARGALQHGVRCRHDDPRARPNFAEVLTATLGGEPLVRVHTR